MVGESVQQRAGEPFRAEDLSPLVERQIGGRLVGSPLSQPRAGPVNGTEGGALSRTEPAAVRFSA